MLSPEVFANSALAALGAYFESCPDAVVTLDLDGRITGFNAAAETFYSVEGREVLGLTFTDLLEEPDRAWQQSANAVVHDGEAFGPTETYRALPDGSRQWLSLSGTPLRAGGDVVGSVWQMRDISDTVAEQEDVGIYHRQSDLIQTVAHIGSWEQDLLTGQRTWSREHFRLHKREPDDGTPSLDEFLSDIHPDDRHLSEQADPFDFAFDYRMIRDPDDVRVLRSEGGLVPGPPGHPGYLVGTIRDVTVESYILAELRSTEDRFRQIFDLSPIGIIIMGFDRRRHMVNDSFCEMLGYDRATFLGLSLADLNHPDEFEEDARLIEQLQVGEIPSYRRRKRFRHADGHYVWVEVAVTSIELDASTQERALLFQAHDISHQLEYEHDLQRLADHDPLTGLFNRRAFDHRFRQHVAAVDHGNRQRSGSLLLIDLDHFKHHNDTYGHAIGDAVLVAIAEGMRRRLRKGDVIGRLGGDEFAAVLPEVSPEEAERVAEDLVQAIREAAAEVSPDSRFPVTASIGVADFRVGCDGDALVREADGAMYQAKDQGRDRWARLDEAPVGAEEAVSA